MVKSFVLLLSNCIQLLVVLHYKIAYVKRGFKRSIGIVQTAFSQEYTVEKLLQDGNYYIAIWSGKVTHDGTFLDFLPPTGNSLNMTGITIYEIINDKITQHWEQFDQLGMMTQLGLIQKK